MNPTLQKAITEAKDRNPAVARRMLLKVLDSEPENEAAWLWLAYVLENPVHRREALETALQINPDSKQARAGLAQLEQTESAKTQPEPISAPSSAPSPSPQSNEVIHYQANGILISNRRAIFNETTYSMANITSVSHIKDRTLHRKANGRLFMSGLIAAGVAGVLAAIDLGVDTACLASLAMLVGLIGLLMMFLGLVGTSHETIHHNVRIRSSAGEVDAYTTTDPDLAAELIDALNNAIIS